MSWQATAWAKKTRGHKNHTDKALLFAMADYANPESWECWPSQSCLADDLECSIRTIQRSIDNLEAAGFLARLQSGNQYQQSRYKLLGVVSYAQIQGSASDKVTYALPLSDAQTQASDSGKKVNVTPLTSERDIPATVVVQEESSTLSSSSTKTPKARPSVRAATQSFYAAAPNQRVAKLIELGYVLGFERSGIAAQVVKAHGHGKDVVDAMLAAAGAADGDPYEYVIGVFKNGRNEKANGQAGSFGSQGVSGRIPVQSDDAPLTAEEQQRLDRLYPPRPVAKGGGGHGNDAQLDTKPVQE